MATEITAIQCPKCGSTAKTEIRPYDYRCSSCGTEYFLDNGFINTGARLISIGSETTATKSKGKPAALGCFVAALVLVVVIAISLIAGVAGSSSHSQNSTANSGAATMPTTWQ